MRERRRGSRFGLGLLIYCLVFLLLAGAALFVLKLYLQAYEDSRSGNCIDRFLFSCAEGKLDDAWTASLTNMDERLDSEEDERGFVRNMILNADCREIRSDTQSEKRYGLFDADDQCFAQLTMHQSEEEHWGFRAWEVDGIECELGAYTHQYEITVPSDYRVCLGEMELDERFITETDIPYQTLEACRDLVPKQPTMVRYALGPTLHSEPLRVLTAGGREIPEENLNEAYYLSNCSSTVREQLESFALDYLNAYLPYAGDLRRGGIGFWADLRDKIVRGGELEDRLFSVRNNFGFGNTRSIQIVDHTLNLCVDFKDGHYLVDILYRTETEGLHGPVQEDNRVRLLLWEENEKLLTEAMYQY